MAAIKIMILRTASLAAPRSWAPSKTPMAPHRRPYGLLSSPLLICWTTPVGRVVSVLWHQAMGTVIEIVINDWAANSSSAWCRGPGLAVSSSPTVGMEGISSFAFQHHTGPIFQIGAPPPGKSLQKEDNEIWVSNHLLPLNQTGAYQALEIQTSREVQVKGKRNLKWVVGEEVMNIIYGLGTSTVGKVAGLVSLLGSSLTRILDWPWPWRNTVTD